MKNNNLDNHHDNLMKLGDIMFSFYEGKELTEEQIMLIKNATDKQKILAMEIVSFSSLEGEKYTNFCHNVRILRNIITSGKFEKMSEYYNYLWDLGRVMLAYYRCEELLTAEEVELIADASDEDKFAAMEVAILNENNYKYKKDIYIRNTASINRGKRKKGKI